MIKDFKIDIPFNNKRTKARLDEAIQKGPKMNELNRRFYTVRKRKKRIMIKTLE